MDSVCRKSHLRAYDEMMKRGLNPSVYVVLSALKHCSSLRDLSSGARIHADLIRSGRVSNLFVANTLIDMYGKCGCMVDANNLFERIKSRDVVSWNCIIMGHAHNGNGEMALELYLRMKENEEIEPDRVTFLAALKACTSLAEKRHCLKKGKDIHSQIITSGHELDICIANSLVSMFAKCGSMTDARKVFDKLPRHNLVLWNCLIMGYADNGHAELAFEFYRRMEAEGCPPNHITFTAVLKACIGLAEKEEGKHLEGRLVKRSCLEKGRMIHFEAAVLGLELDHLVSNMLVDMYVKCGSIKDAYDVFERMLSRDVVSWTAIILGFTQIEEWEIVLHLYARMEAEYCSPNALTFAPVLVACGNLVVVETGKKIHARICSSGTLALDSDPVLATCLIDFYCKCGNVDDAQNVFDVVSHGKRDVVMWSALIAGYSREGKAKQAFELFDKMQEDCVEPNGTTFLSILTACSHSGLVDKGKNYFESMLLKYGITPNIEHCNCMIDLLGRVNQLDEVVALMKNMIAEPDLKLWTIVLTACSKSVNVEAGMMAFESLLRIDERSSAAYVMMGNIYALAGIVSK